MRPQARAARAAPSGRHDATAGLLLAGDPELRAPLRDQRSVSRRDRRRWRMAAAPGRSHRAAGPRSRPMTALDALTRTVLLIRDFITEHEASDETVVAALTSTSVAI